MADNMAIDLKEAQRVILQRCEVLPEENVPLDVSLHRYPARSLKALMPLPGFDASLRDGYAIAKPGKEEGAEECFRVVTEVAAGDIRKIRLAHGEAVRIMTGGLIPAGCQGVVPQEQCQVDKGNVLVPKQYLQKRGFFIHAKGADLKKNQTIIARGISICPEHQIDLAGVGYSMLPVRQRAKVSFFCSGSELVAPGKAKVAGEKFSANPSLLQSLLALAGANGENCGTVSDDIEGVCHLFNDIVKTDSDVIISTGGMGPGRYDLLEEAFTRVGGTVLYHSLKLRPGKSTLFGVVGGKLFFGMPGPPPAVFLLFNELIRPALLALQGARHCLPQTARAFLSDELPLRKRGLARLKSGRLENVDASCRVRPAKHGEAANCYIYCPPGRRLLRKNEKVQVHLLSEGVVSVSHSSFF